MRGAKGESAAPVGTVTIRTRHGRGGIRRAWVKIAEPNVWVLRARAAWEQHNGPIPKGMGIHHKDENPLNDELDNLELVTKKEHLLRHIDAYHKTSVPKLVAARRDRRWSTKSKTKRVGRHPRGCDCPLHGGAAA